MGVPFPELILSVQNGFWVSLPRSRGVLHVTPRVSIQREKLDFIDHPGISGATYSLCSLEFQILPTESFPPFTQIVPFKNVNTHTGTGKENESNEKDRHRQRERRMIHFVLGFGAKSGRRCEGLAACWLWYQRQQAAPSCLRASGQPLLHS